MSLLDKLLLMPVFFHVAMIVTIGIRLARARFKAGRAGQVSLKKIALDNSAWPDEVRKLSNNYVNQFEFPMLFYALVALVLITQRNDWVFVGLGFLFMATRLVHATIHTGSNVVISRFQAFIAGVTILTSMWVWFALRIYVIG